MGSIIVFLLVVLAIYVFVVFILPLLAAFGGAAALAIAAAAAAAGLVFAVKNYLAAIRSCVSFTHWEWTRDDEPARRSYFFGPGFAQLTGAVRTAFRLNAASAGKLRAAGRRIRGTNGGVLGAVRAAGGAIFTTVASACVYCAGAILCAVFAAVHGAVTSLVMAAAVRVSFGWVQAGSSRISISISIRSFPLHYKKAARRPQPIPDRWSVWGDRRRRSALIRLPAIPGTGENRCGGSREGPRPSCGTAPSTGRCGPR